MFIVGQYSSISLAEAKHWVDSCLASRETTISTKDVASAKQLVAALAEIGFLGVVSYSATRQITVS